MVAIVTDVHYRMSLALIRDLGQAGVDVITCERESRSPAPGAAGRRQGRAVPGHPPCAEGTVPVDKGPAYRTVPPSKSGVVPGLLCRP